MKGISLRIITAAALMLCAAPTLLHAGLTAKQQYAMRDTQVVKVVRKVSPCVVYISCRHRVQNPFAGSIWDLFGGDAFGQQQAEEEYSLGSGVIVDPKGYILTNEHVIIGGSDIRVTLTNGKRYPAKVVGAAPEMDLALLKISGDRPFPVAELGRSDDLMIGEPVIAVGNPYGLSNTVTVGVLSAVGRTFKSGNREYSDFLQTDAPINPGNSGGPLLNILGQVIGINTAIIKNAQGIGFAIPIDRAHRVMDQLRVYGHIKPTWLGFLALDPSEAYRRKMGDRKGVIVAKTYPYAYPQNDIHPGDYLTEMNGKAIDDAGDLNAKLPLLPVGQAVTLSGLRHGKPFKATLKAKRMPDELTPGMTWALLGIRVAPARGGLVIANVRPDSPADATGLRPGDYILAVDDHSVATPKAFYGRARTALGSTGLLLSVGRGGWKYYVTLNLLTP